MSDGPELTPEDVKEILRLVDESGLEELELETPRFTVRFRRGADPCGRPRSRRAGGRSRARRHEWKRATSSR